MKNCVVLNCDHFEPAKYVFPNPGKHPELFCKWIQLCGNPRLTERNPNTIQANEKLCINHFKDSDFTSKGKLLRKSIPSLNLPESIKYEISDMRKYRTLNKNIRTGKSKQDSSANSLDTSEVHTTMELFEKSEIPDMEITQDLIEESIDDLNICNNSNINKESNPEIMDVSTQDNDNITENINDDESIKIEEENEIYDSSSFVDMVIDKLNSMKKFQSFIAENLIHDILYNGCLNKLNDDCKIIEPQEAKARLQNFEIDGNVLILKKTKQSWLLMKCDTKSFEKPF